MVIINLWVALGRNYEAGQRSDQQEEGRELLRGILDLVDEQQQLFERR